MPKAFNSDGNEIMTNVPLWPALWMMGSGIWNDTTNQSWPYCGEIDIMEWSSSSSKGVNNYSHAIHYNDGINYNNQYLSGSYDANKNLTTEYHRYKTTINHPNNGSATINMYFDDIPVGSYLLDEDKYNELYQTVNKSGEIVDTSKHYGLIMNIALAGSYTGFNGDINQFESQYPVFDNAIMYVKSIDISSENI